MIFKGRLLWASSLCALIPCVTATGVQAQQQQTQLALEEIIVTARRSSENLMEVPVAISAVTSADIESSGAKDLQELSRFTPGLFASVSGNGRIDRSNTNLTFRGLSVASGLTFIDGAPYTGAGSPDITDAARIEVLKGPQSVYFGRSTYSGAVNYVLKEPGEQFAGRIAAEAYSYGSHDLHVSLEGPITDNFGIRVAGRRYSTAGQWANPFSSARMGAQDTSSYNVYALARPTDALRISAFYSWRLDRDGQGPTAALLPRTLNMTTTTDIRTGGELQCNAGSGLRYWCGKIPAIETFLRDNPLFVSVYDRIDPVTQYRLLDNGVVLQSQTGQPVVYPNAIDAKWINGLGMKRQYQNAHLKADFETDEGWAIASITAWARTKNAAINDTNYRDSSRIPNRFYVSPTATPLLTPNDVRLNYASSINNDLSQEVRVTSPSDKRLRGVLGLSYAKAWIPRSGLTGVGISGTTQNASIKNSNDTPAVFGAGYYDIRPDLTLSMEARYQWDKIKQQQLFPTVFPLDGPIKGTFKSFSPRVSLDWSYADNSMIYVLYSRGYRPGGFNTSLVASIPLVRQLLAATGANVNVEQERLDNYEVGLKSTWLDNRLQTTFAVYRARWANGQITEMIPAINPATGVSLGQFTVRTNVGKVNLTGFEAEARFAATENLTVHASLAYMNNKIVNYNFVQGVRITGSTNVNGNRLDQSPKITASLSPQYTDHLFGDWDWNVRVDLTHRSRTFVEATNVAWIAPLTLVNLRVGISTEHFTLDAYVKNLLDNSNITEGVLGQGDNIAGNVAQLVIRVGVPQKRVIGIRGAYNF